ncbi:hypothetical protein EJB05_22668, partial [Eragrostis curvula]
MDQFTWSMRRHWMMEEEDDDTLFFVDDDEVEAWTYNQLVQAESSRPRRRRRYNAPPKVIRPRNLPGGHRQIKDDYFVENPVYNDYQFRRRFWMRRHLFKRIKEAVKNHDNCFQKKCDAAGKERLSALQKCVESLRILAYGVPADAMDEAVIDVFGKQYLRAPNETDVARLLQEGENRGFPGMLGSIDCMHWEWKNCPAGWKGQFTGRGIKPSMILEAVASHDLGIWHAYFGMPGSNNDINVLHRSHVFSFSGYLRGRSTPVEFAVNGRTYNMGYYLADGIYPDWAAFVKTIRYPIEEKAKYFAGK